MITLAIDYAHRHTGWVIINNGRTENWGVFSTKPPKKKSKNKLIALKVEQRNCWTNYKKICLLIEDYGPDRIVVEVPYFSQKVSDSILIGMGIYMISTFEPELLIASTVKEILTGKGNASKAEIASIVRSKAIPAEGHKSILFAKDHVHDAFAAYLATKSPKYEILKQAIYEAR